MSFEHIPPRPDLPLPPSPWVFVTAGGQRDRPKATWRVWEAVAVYLVAIVIASFATLPFLQLIEDEDLALLSASAAVAVVIVGVVLAWLSRFHPTWRQVVGFPGRGRWWREIRTAVGFGLVLYPLMVFVVGLVLSLVLGAVSGEPAQPPEQVPPELSTVGVVVTILYAIVIAPVHEELFFRGVLFRGVRDRYGLQSGLLASGVGFSFVHYIPAAWQDTALLMGVMFFNGVALAWFYDRRGTVVAPVVTHVVFNVIGLSVILLVG
jgi:membrane protease YdiL (CAAX protease family)